MSSTTQTSHTPRQRKQTMYERYLRTDELLDLQKPDEERLHPDELTFQVVHQTFELWWKMTIQQMRRATEQLRSGGYGEAARALRRAVSAQGVGHRRCATRIRLARHFLVIRTGLGDGSGADSPGFRAILRATPDLWEAFEGRWRVNISRPGRYLMTPLAHPALYDCAEELTDFDEHSMSSARPISSWRSATSASRPPAPAARRWSCSRAPWVTCSSRRSGRRVTPCWRRCRRQQGQGGHPVRLATATANSLRISVFAGRL